MLLSKTRGYFSRVVNRKKFTCISGGEVSRSRSLFSSVESSTDNSGERIKIQITATGDKVRALKAANGPKGEIEAAVAELLDLKSKFEKVTGTSYDQTSTNKSKERKEEYRQRDFCCKYDNKQRL